MWAASNTGTGYPVNLASSGSWLPFATRITTRSKSPGSADSSGRPLSSQPPIRTEAISGSA